MERTVVVARILGPNGDFSLRNQNGFAGLKDTRAFRLKKGCLTANYSNLAKMRSSINGKLFEFG